MSKDFVVDPFYDLYASDFLSEEEINVATEPRALSDDDAVFWAALRNGEVHNV